MNQSTARARDDGPIPTDGDGHEGEIRGTFSIPVTVVHVKDHVRTILADLSDDPETPDYSKIAS